MRSSHRWAGAVLAIGVLLATAGCSGSSDGAASPGASTSPSASPSPTGTSTGSSNIGSTATPTNVHDYPKATFNAEATGAVTGTMKNPGAGGCRILTNNDPGVALNIGMGVTVPTKKTAVMVIAVAQPGKSSFGGATFMTVFGYGDVWNTQNEGGGGTVDVSADGHKGSFDATMPANAGGTPLHVVGSFTCP